MNDWTGNKKSVFATLGASSHSDSERQKEDFYATEPRALEIFLDKLKEDNIILDNQIWECACGQGHLAGVLKERGFVVYSTDLVDRGYGETGDFLKD
jgi:2-polyprenyl-3-methyl-5-hydroxy-6-metoxy-1,4-benzoquinol methylase